MDVYFWWLRQYYTLRHCIITYLSLCCFVSLLVCEPKVTSSMYISSSIIITVAIHLVMWKVIPSLYIYRKSSLPSFIFQFILFKGNLICQPIGLENSPTLFERIYLLWVKNVKKETRSKLYLLTFNDTLALYAGCDVFSSQLIHQIPQILMKFMFLGSLYLRNSYISNIEIFV